MEDPGILALRRIRARWRSWPAVRKAQLVSGAFGASLTVGVHFLLSLFGSGESSIAVILGFPWGIALLPPWEISRLLGWTWKLGTTVFELPLPFWVWLH
jgi:hypothetical protein